MKVWVVMVGSHEDKYPVAVFSDKAKAEEFVKRNPLDRWIQDDEGLEVDGPPKYQGL